MAKLPSPSSPSHRETGEAGLAGGGLGPAAQGARAAGIVGKRGGGMWGIDSPTHLGPGRSEEAGRRGPVAAALLERGGGASAEEGRRWRPGRLECGVAAPVGRLL